VFNTPDESREDISPVPLQRITHFRGEELEERGILPPSLPKGFHSRIDSTYLPNLDDEIDSEIWRRVVLLLKPSLATFVK